MLELYKDKKQILECKIKVESKDVKLKDIVATLILSEGNNQFTFDGSVNALGICKIEIPPMNRFNLTEGKATIQVRISDAILEPYKAEYRVNKQMVDVSEVVVVDEENAREQEKEIKPSKMFLDSCMPEDKKMVNEMLKKFNALSVKHKKTLREYVDYNYESSKKTKTWATKIFKDINSVQAKMIMYEIENIFIKK